MSTKETTAARGKREGREALEAVGREFRLARTRAALSQAEVARRMGRSASSIGRLERGDRAQQGVVELSEALAIVGCRLILRVGPHGSPVRDAAHARLLAAVRQLLPAHLPWSVEVPLPLPGDLRAWDAVTRLERLRVAFEGETRARDGQELARRLALKRRDGSIDRLVLVLQDTRANREFLRLHGPALREAFPTGSDLAIAALREGRDPGDAIILLRPLSAV